MSGAWFTQLSLLALGFRPFLIGGVVVLALLLALFDSRRRGMHLRWMLAAILLGALLEFVLRMNQLPYELLALVPMGLPIGYVVRLYGTRLFHQAPVSERPVKRPGRGAGVASPPVAGAARPLAPGAARAPVTPPRAAAPAPAAEEILPIRSIAEEHLYMDFHPCSCGEADWSNLKQKLQMIGLTMASVFMGACRRCGTPRQFQFHVLEPTAYPKDGSFGGPEPSPILDPGQWLEASDRWAKDVPGSAKSLDTTAKRRAGATLQKAAWAMDEVLKFIPPGADEVPRSAFKSDESARFIAEMPRQFQRFRLQARLEAYRGLLKQFEILTRHHQVWADSLRDLDASGRGVPLAPLRGRSGRSPSLAGAIRPLVDSAWRTQQVRRMPQIPPSQRSNEPQVRSIIASRHQRPRPRPIASDANVQ